MVADVIKLAQDELTLITGSEELNGDEVNHSGEVQETNIQEQEQTATALGEQKLNHFGDLEENHIPEPESGGGGDVKKDFEDNIINEPTEESQLEHGEFH